MTKIRTAVSRDPTIGGLALSTVWVTDDDLVARARQGDSDAFGQLVDRHRTAVYRAARAALGSHADAEDAAQDAFVIAYQRLSSFRGDASFKTWLLTIAWRQAINRRRGARRWVQRLVGTGNEDGALEIPTDAPSPEAGLAATELRQAIAAEIRRLTPKLRDTLLLARGGELSYDEVAAILKIPVGTVKWRVSESRRIIRTRLKERGFVDASE